MAVQETRVLPPEFIEAAGKTFLEQLSSATGGFGTADLSKIFGPQFVAGQDQLQKDAEQLAVSGIGGYKPFLQSAQAAQALAAGQVGQAGTLAGQAAQQAGKAGQFMGPQAYQQFMSPYQKDIIDTTLAEFDVQTQKGLPGLAAKAIGAGAFGGAREGVQQAEFLSNQNRNRAALQAQLLGQGFGQAQQAAAQAFGQQQALANQQQQLANQALGIGQAFSGLGQQQIGLGQAGQGFLGQDVGVLTTLGAQNQAQQQAQLQAQQQLLQQQLQQPLTAAQTYGSGVTSLIAGYPGQTTQTNIPTPSALQSGLSAGSTLAGIYRLLQGPQGGSFFTS
jgi:hypothetical protein